ncbi:MAG: response regulator [Candidatus Marinimicrobia bacterium]|nr:response regulator [Candidatus Neomarinimicrobiota bacterium]MBL7047064.1 response regulator [Candidatus Neomarinimicrobiota bacterium]
MKPEKKEIKILVVDDEPMSYKHIARQLSNENYTFTHALNGEEALKKIHSGEKYNLILLDIMLPKMDGYEVCRRIRKHFLQSELPIIMITAKDKVNDLVDGFASGSNDYIIKPYTKEELQSRVKAHLHLLQINNAYGKFLPRRFLRVLRKDDILDLKLGDQIQGEMTIMFSDIRSFTRLSEGMSPKENFNFLNEYLKVATPPIRSNNGFIDKYIGDGIMALFPKCPDDGINASIDTLKRLENFNKNRQKVKKSPVRIGIGLHTGLLMLGTIGDEERMDGTVISDAVNLASRLEGLTKKYRSTILISSHTMGKLENPDKYNHRFLGKVKVKGKNDIVSVIEIYDGDPDHIIELKKKTKPLFEQGLKFYFERDFA